MTKAGSPKSSPGWPPPGPTSGFCQVPHYAIERIWRVAGTPVEVGCVLLILDQTVGYQRESIELAVGWLAEKLGVTERAILGGLEAAGKRGILLKERVGLYNEYCIDLAALAEAPDHEKAEKPVKVTPARERPVTTHPIRYSSVKYLDRVFTLPPGADLLTSDHDAAAISECDECHCVGLHSLIPCDHLEFSGEEVAKGELQFRSDGDETAKGEVEFRSGEGQAKPEAQFRSSKEKAKGPQPGKRAAKSIQPKGLADGHSNRSKGGASPSKKSSSDPRVKALHKQLLKWRVAFHDTPATMKQAASIAEALGDAPPAYLEGIMQGRARWIYEKADHYGALIPMARQALEAYEATMAEDEETGGAEPSSPAASVKYPKHECWDDARVILRRRLGEINYANWIAATGAEAGSGEGALVVLAANTASAEWIREEYGEQIARIMEGYGVTSIEYRAIEPVEVISA